jgi:hypothetical protein
MTLADTNLPTYGPPCQDWSIYNILKTTELHQISRHRSAHIKIINLPYWESIGSLDTYLHIIDRPGSTILQVAKHPLLFDSYYYQYHGPGINIETHLSHYSGLVLHHAQPYPSSINSTYTWQGNGAGTFHNVRAIWKLSEQIIYNKQLWMHHRVHYKLFITWVSSTVSGK